jgi:hypothetical protein
MIEASDMSSTPVPAQTASRITSATALMSLNKRLTWVIACIDADQKPAALYVPPA